MSSGRARVLWAEIGGALAAAVLIAGCGNNYRPTVSPIVSSGPASQPTSYAVVVSYTSATQAGVATIIDYAGDSVMAEAPIGVGPQAFTIDVTGSSGYTFNSDHTITIFPISTTLQQKNESTTTLPSNALPVNLFLPNFAMWIGDLTGNVIDQFSGFPQSFKLALPLAIPSGTVTAPVYVAGSPSSTGQREYVVSQNVNSAGPLPSGVECNISPRTQPNGVVTPVEISSTTLDAPIPVGQCPVYAVQTPDQRRLFVLNRGSDSISVINSQNNSLDQCTPFQNQNGQWVTCHPTIQLPAGSGPVYADYNSATQKLVVANYDSGTISVIDVTEDEYGNDANTYTNSNCATYAACGAITGGFGAVKTITVGKNPASVTVLADGSRAYTANQGDCIPNCTSSANGSVSVVNLNSYSLEKTLQVIGVPRTVVSTQNSLYGKVYVASTNTPYLTIISTTTDLINADVLVEGNVVDVRATTQTGSSQTYGTYNGSVNISNPNYSSRIPGYGQPCNLPPSLLGGSYTLAQCSAIP